MLLLCSFKPVKFSLNVFLPCDILSSRKGQKCCSTPHLLLPNGIQWRIGQFIGPKQFIFQQSLTRDDLCWEMPHASTAYWWLYANMSVVLTIWTLFGRKKQVVILCPHCPNTTWFSSFIFFWVPSPGKVKKKNNNKKNTSLHWAYIDYFFPEDLFLSLVLDRKISKSSQGPVLKHLGLSSYTSGPMTPFFKCVVCILVFSWYELKIIALSILVTDSMPRFLNQLFREWLFGFSSHLSHCLHLKVFKNRIILSQCVTV